MRVGGRPETDRTSQGGRNRPGGTVGRMTGMTRARASSPAKPPGLVVCSGQHQVLHGATRVRTQLAPGASALGLLAAGHGLRVLGPDMRLPQVACAEPDLASAGTPW